MTEKNSPGKQINNYQLFQYVTQEYQHATLMQEPALVKKPPNRPPHFGKSLNQTKQDNELIQTVGDKIFHLRL
ncbi:hypothetical protein DMR_09690 [Solidesulfovibrio magneticus RS-1]|uniref:Uncharacterized protein n=2 Tax=Solidesulfovibrio TaxID=2910984 RepID=C4XKS1_SOLM1|nr:hypothetical protein DMR_09690 [Solidesulfovibrio magneticus RS-1]